MSPGPNPSESNWKRVAARHNIVAVLLALLVISLFYTNQFHQREDSIVNCEQRNEQIQEVNKRAPAINALLHIESSEPEHKEDLSVLRRNHVERVELTDCDEVFEKPWPF